MKVERISTRALEALVTGRAREKAKCVVKFYSNGCTFCHNLQNAYKELAEQYPDTHFFAFNIDDVPAFEARLGFKGVPTLIMIDIDPPTSHVRVMSEPTNPNELTWYAPTAIKNFIEGKMSYE